MASEILVARPLGVYTLPEADRQKILAQAPSHMLRLEIERQRRAFVQANGNEFGEGIVGDHHALHDARANSQAFI